MNITILKILFRWLGI